MGNATLCMKHQTHTRRLPWTHLVQGIIATLAALLLTPRTRLLAHSQRTLTVRTAQAELLMDCQLVCFLSGHATTTPMLCAASARSASSSAWISSHDSWSLRMSRSCRAMVCRASWYCSEVSLHIACPFLVVVQLIHYVTEMLDGPEMPVH